MRLFMSAVACRRLAGQVSPVGTSPARSLWVKKKRLQKINAQTRLNPCPAAATHPDNHPGSPGSPLPEKIRPHWHYAIFALPLLIAFGGFIAIACIAADRFSEFEYGHSWRAITLTAPYAVELEGSPTFVTTKLDLGPWEEQYYLADGIYEQPVDVGFRRLLSRLHKAAKYESKTARTYKRMAQLMAGAADKPRRSLLSGGPSIPIPDSALPILQVFVGQDFGNASNPAEYTPIDDTKECKFKSNIAVECVFDFKMIVRPDPTRPCYLITRLLYPTNDPDLGVAANVEVTQMGTFGLYKEWIALTVVGLVLIGIAVEVFHRMWVAFCGGFAMLGLLLIGNQAPDLEHVMTFIDFGTLGLLFGMMLIVGQLQRTGVFEVICAYCLRGSKGNLLYLTLYITLITAFLSMWLDNVTTVLLMVPMTIAVFKAMDRDPIPLLLAQAMMSNIGGAATMIGDPPNIIIGNELRNFIGFVDFLENLAPGVLIATPFVIATLVLIYRHSLYGKVPGFSDVVAIVDEYKIKDWNLFYKCMYAVGGIIIGFLLHPIHDLNVAWIALVIATILILSVERQNVHAVLHAIEWDMLLFFAGMFIMVEGALELGLIRKIAAFLTLIIDSAPFDSQEIVAIEVILWFSAIFSALLDNIPYTITMIPVIEALAENNSQLSLKTLAWALAFGACFGGNGTLIGASANIVTVGLADNAGYHISFVKWLQAGVPVLAVSIAAVNVYMLVRYGI